MGNQLPGELLELVAELKDLPALARLMPSPWELGRVVEGVDVDVDDVMEKLGMLLREEVADEEGFGEVGKESFISQTDATASISTIGKKKKRKQEKAKMNGKGSEGVEEGGGNNMFQMLA